MDTTILSAGSVLVLKNRVGNWRSCEVLLVVYICYNRFTHGGLLYSLSAAMLFSVTNNVCVAADFLNQLLLDLSTS